MSASFLYVAHMPKSTQPEGTRTVGCGTESMPQRNGHRPPTPTPQEEGVNQGEGHGVLQSNPASRTSSPLPLPASLVIYSPGRPQHVYESAAASAQKRKQKRKGRCNSRNISVPRC